jgi:hypothetical protein
MSDVTAGTADEVNNSPGVSGVLAALLTNDLDEWLVRQQVRVTLKHNRYTLLTHIYIYAYIHTYVHMYKACA